MAFPSTSYAANECGTTTSGGPVTCTGTTTIGAVVYNQPVAITIDGTVNSPVTYNGANAVTINLPAGVDVDTSIRTIGPVTLTGGGNAAFIRSIFFAGSAGSGNQNFNVAIGPQSVLRATGGGASSLVRTIHIDTGPITGTTNITIDAGAQIFATGSGATMFGIVAGGTGDTTTVNKGYIETNNTGSGTAYGIAASPRGAGTNNIITNGPTSSITVNGSASGSGFAIYAGSNSSGVISHVINQGTITTSGSSVHGAGFVASSYSATGTLTNSASITTNGNNSNGMHAQYSHNSNQPITINNIGVVTTGGNMANGISITRSRGAVTDIVTTTGTITTTGTGSDGIFVNSSTGNANIYVNAGFVTGGSGVAAAVHSSAHLGTELTIAAAAQLSAASGVAIRNGDVNRDLVDENNKAIIVRTEGTITGDSILGGGTSQFHLLGGSVIGTIYGDAANPDATGGNDQFFWTTGALNGGYVGGRGSDTATISATSYDGSQLLDGGDDSSTSDGFTDTLNINGLTVTSTGAKIINWERVNLTDTSMSISDGAWQVGAATQTATGVFLTNATLIGMTGLALTGNASIDPNSTLSITGGASAVYSVSGTLTNNGKITSQGGVAGEVLTVASYQGGGVWELDTALGDDSSTSDRMVVATDASGVTRLKINNAGGAGAATTGDGILLVSAPLSSTGSFVLDSSDEFLGQPAIIINGYAYTLHRGSASGTDNGNWYLRSTTILPFSLGLTKSSVIISDPVNGTTNAMHIPGAVVDYQIHLTNSGHSSADDNTIVVTDILPPNLALRVADYPGTSGPVSYIEGNSACGLGLQFDGIGAAADSLEFSNDNGVTWNYVPSGEYDANVSGVRVRFTGSMSALSGMSSPCAIKFRTQVQ